VTFVSDEPKASLCQQCGIEFPRGRLNDTPFDMISSHSERWVYTLKDDPTPRPSLKYTTKFYCVRSSCVLQRFDYFDARTDLEISESVRNRLHNSHLKQLEEQLNYTL
jgi:hypothetical protein